jgi:hypothetical protein
MCETSVMNQNFSSDIVNPSFSSCFRRTLLMFIPATFTVTPESEMDHSGHFKFERKNMARCSFIKIQTVYKSQDIIGMDLN